MSQLVLHGFILSPPVRSVMMVCKALNVPFIFKEINPLEMDHYKPEYLKLCPIHSIPVIEDGNYALFDSHAIASYIASKYAKDDKWYPKDPQQRGIVDQRLHFNNGMLILRFKDMLLPIFLGRRKGVDPKAVKRVEEGMKQFDQLLGESNFLAGNECTIADCCSSPVVSSIEIILPNSVTKRVSDWLRRCEKTLPDFQQVNQPAISVMASFKTSML